MSREYVEFRKKQTYPCRCVICGKSFVSHYDETINAFPVYHGLKPAENPYESCEHRFYKTLLRIYHFIHKRRVSVTMSHILNEFNWLDYVLMKKEHIGWSLKRGYLTLDNLSRINIPEEVAEPCKEIFQRANLEDEESLNGAVALLKAALRCLSKELKKTQTSELIPETVKPQTDHDEQVGPSDAGKPPGNKPAVEPEKQRNRMHTIQHTGAGEFVLRRQRSR